MKNSFEYLSDDDLDFLDTFLLSRFDEEGEDDLDADEGVLCVSEMDGLFTAIVSGPVMIPPSEWMPVMWGDFPPEWEDEASVQKILSLMMQHMNSIATMLMTQSDYFGALFLERVVDGKTYTIVDEWCEGYMRGVAMAAEQWQIDHIDMQILLAPIKAFAGDAAVSTHETYNGKEIENLQENIRLNAREIHAYWLARRQDDVAVQSPVQRTEPRIGRNEPCPCGSGKKYKKCCLH